MGEINGMSLLYDQLYLLFDDYIVKNIKHVNTYKSIFLKKEFCEFVKNHGNVATRRNELITSKDEIIDELIYAFKMFGKYINTCDMFSENEEVDDISTKSLKFLLIPYILGILSYETVNMDIRYDRLKDSKLYFNEFISIINIYKIIQMNEYLLDKDEKEINEMNRRNIKVKRAKDEKKYQDMYDEITKIKIKKGTTQNYNPSISSYDTEDEEHREMYLSLIKHKCIQTLNTIDLIDTELQVLEMRNRELVQKSGKHPNDGGGGCVNNNNDNSRLNDNQYGTIRKPWLFTIKKNMQISDMTEIRNYYRDLVFRPAHNLPTISLEECAKVEMEYALKGSGVANTNKKNGDNNTLSNEDQNGVIKNDINDDDYYKKCSKEENEKDIMDREWDDWKDLHQKGIGNKNRNVA
ncbi:type 2A phosphatase-associated protein 42 [Plasmodium gonderi]|uniref:Type 2A phosphatase-associated protein 42 n=1 Tax=Plasmodium gonderi TaxID=77519 RepID=A0A1Y1JA41_PLAGO|nr:type 2A phosphatase-associated protein 42 [Plasmodium gonderi]GAW79381.1 type 2A phosphatase-associated protein 42 [Plasmodium gonderi]